MKKQQAFTLVELVVVVAIIGILSAIAVPNYSRHVSKARREDAKGALVAFANAMERKYTETSSYCDLADAGGATVTGCGTSTNDKGAPAASFFSSKSPLDGPDSFYNLTISDVTPNSFTIQAAPITSVTNDKCGTLTLTHTGVRGILNQSTGVVLGDCW